jgi:hypothetical protein
LDENFDRIYVVLKFFYRFDDYYMGKNEAQKACNAFVLNGYII